MSIAPAWLETSSLFPVFISDKPGDDTGIIVVIPSFDEPGITDLLDSFLKCNPSECKCEVLIIINAPQNAHSDSLERNRETFNKVVNWININKESFFKVYVADLGQPKIKRWGVGLARRAGMDEAAKRFLSLNNPDGVIASMDADCTVSRNYFTALENELLNSKKRNGCSIYFEHPINGTQLPESFYKAVYQYELHLRYYYQALKYTGFPNVYHTVGSSFAVKTSTYVKAGGMNRNQAGEDFYFIQKVVSTGGYFSLNSATVFPSSRISDRVPFGTGVVVGKMILNNESELLTYNPIAFIDLKLFFEKTEFFFRCPVNELIPYFDILPKSIRGFLTVDLWVEKILEIRSNTSGSEAFSKRFFNWFNMFRIVKYLNYSHETMFEKVPVNTAAKEILVLLGRGLVKTDKAGLLEYFRSLEKEF